MTKPVEVFEGDTLMHTRKTTEDWFLFRPTYATRMLVGFMVLYWAERYGIEVLAIIILSNHFHVIYRDPRALSPDFTCQVDHWIARIMNRRTGRTGKSFFAPGPCRPMRLLEPPDIEEELDYVATNAPRHGLTARAYSWPGLLFGPEDVGTRMQFPRPPELANSKVFPEKIAYIVPAPDHLRDLTDRQIERKFRKLRRATEAEESRRRNGRFMGVVRAMTVPTFSRPRTVKESEFKPFFTSRNPDALAAAKKSRAQFLRAHDRELKRFRAGERDLEWPAGTFKMRRRYALPPPCAPPPQ